MHVCGWVCFCGCMWVGACLGECMSADGCMSVFCVGVYVCGWMHVCEYVGGGGACLWMWGGGMYVWM